MPLILCRLAILERSALDLLTCVLHFSTLMGISQGRVYQEGYLYLTSQVKEAKLFRCQWCFESWLSKLCPRSLGELKWEQNQNQNGLGRVNVDSPSLRVYEKAKTVSFNFVRNSFSLPHLRVHALCFLQLLNHVSSSSRRVWCKSVMVKSDGGMQQ